MSLKNFYIYILILFFIGCGESVSKTSNTPNTKPDIPKKEIKVKKLTIEGELKKTVHIYDLYQFSAKVNKSKTNDLQFYIKNRPSWAKFDKRRGLLEGSPSIGDEGEYSDIVISVSDGKEKALLPSFSIRVLPAVDIAYKYGKATQGTNSSYHYFKEASNAIDHNDSSYNHTSGGKDGKNWLQIELPNPTIVSKIVIQNGNGNKKRLSNAKVYLSDTPFEGSIDEKYLIHILRPSDSEQIINLTPPKSGRFLLIKGEQRDEDDRHIHLKKVEVYGKTPPTPAFITKDDRFLISGATKIGTKVTKLEAIDYQDDSISYKIIEDVPFFIDKNGNITVSGPLSSPRYRFDVEISDGVNSRRKRLLIDVTEKSVIEKVLKSGDILSTNVTEDELIKAAKDEIESLRRGSYLYDEIYQDGAIRYNSGSNSQIIKILGDSKRVVPIVYGNKKSVLAVAGIKNRSRFSIFASNPLKFFDDRENLDFEPYMKRVLLWLLGSDLSNSDIEESEKSVVLSFCTNKASIKSWIGENYPKWKIKECDDRDSLESCYKGTDLIILGHQADDEDAQLFKNVIEEVTEESTPILYLHDTWGRDSFSDTFGSIFGVEFPHGGNFWARDFASWESAKQMQRIWFENQGYELMERLLEHFQNGDFAFDWSRCVNSKGMKDENGDECSEVDGLYSEFFDGAKTIRNYLSNLDSHKIDIFKTNDYRLFKLLALLGDKFRQSVVFPMDKVSSDDNEFMKSFYADFSVYNYRSINPVQVDMGNFSRSDFSDIIPVTKSVELISKKPFRALGVYVLPNKTVKITRLDHNSSTISKIFINTLRSGATHQFQKDGYKRPKYLQSTHIEIKPNETIYMTSPYGGPLEVEFSQNGAKVSFKIENVGLHPYWSEFDADPNKDNNFAKALEEDRYDWAEIITSAFEVHSKREKILESINNIRWGSASALAEATKTYASSYVMSLAGYKGPGIRVEDDIVKYATLKDIPIYNADFVKHMNADQASCGFGCSGNPYDAYWSFDPISHGDIHEVGHSLEKALFRLKGWELHSSTNYYAYYTQIRYNQYVEANGLDEKYYIRNVHISKRVFKKQYESLQNCVDKKDKKSCMQSYWDSSNYSGQSLFNIEAMMYAQKYAKGDYSLENGFHLLGRLHILERFLEKDAKKDWESAKGRLGFSDYSKDEVEKINSNDWLLISLSWATGLDYRSFFDMYGQTYSNRASKQVESYEFEAVKKVFFAEDDDSGFILPSKSSGDYLDKREIAVDGYSSYPY